jgi:hypothetical protein
VGKAHKVDSSSDMNGQPDDAIILEMQLIVSLTLFDQYER